jgi:hypothetical protein
MVGTGVVFTEPSVDKGMVRRLIVDPKEEELLQLEVWLEFKGNSFEWDGFYGERFWFGCNCSGERVHLIIFDICRVFMELCH